MIDAQLIVGRVQCCHSLRGSALRLCPSTRVVHDRWLVRSTPQPASESLTTYRVEGWWNSGTLRPSPSRENEGGTTGVAPSVVVHTEICSDRWH